MSAQSNKPLVPTRNGEAPSLAAQRRRWAAETQMQSATSIGCSSNVADRREGSMLAHDTRRHSLAFALQPIAGAAGS